MTLTVLVSAGISYALLQSLVVPALPDIQRTMDASQTSVGWVLTAFLLSASVATPILGRLGDMYGKERVLMLVLVVLATGTAICALAQAMPVLIAGRAVQGIGGGIFPLAFGIIRDEFPPEKVAGGIGMLSSLLGVGGGAGVVLAGVIVEHLSYHWLFWLPLGMILLVAVATHLLVPESPIRVPGRVDWLGAGLLSAALLALLVTVSQTTHWGWISARTGIGAATSLLLLAACVRTELRTPLPLVDMRMLRPRAVWTTNLATLLLGVGMYAAFFLIPQFAQEPTSTGYGLGASVVSGGLFLLPFTVLQVLVGQFAGRIERHFGSKPPLVAGAAFMAAGFGLLVIARETPAQLYAASALLGIGVGLSFAAVANLIVAAVRQDQTGVATGLNTVMRTLGGTFGAAVTATILAAHLVTGRPTSSGYGLAFGACGAVVAAAVIVALYVPGRARTHRRLVNA